MRVPVYEFHCRSCRADFSELVSVDAVAPCPDCGDKRPERVFSEFAALTKQGLKETPLETQKQEPQAEPENLPITATFTDCRIENCDTGLKLGPGARVVSERLRVRGTRVAVDNEGVFEDTDTRIE
jgi:putative FmdB family regulatory protein